MWLAVKINEARVNAACRNPPRKHLHFYDRTVPWLLCVKWSQWIKSTSFLRLVSRVHSSYVDSFSPRLWGSSQHSWFNSQIYPTQVNNALLWEQGHFLLAMRRQTGNLMFKLEDIRPSVLFYCLFQLKLWARCSACCFRLIQPFL